MMETKQYVPFTERSKTSGRACAVCVCVTLATVASTANAQLIQNGDFETPIIADGTLQAITPSPWSGGAVLMNPNAAGGLSGNPFTWPQAPSGQQYMDIGNSAPFALSQSFTLAGGGTYSIAWQDNTALNIAPGFMTAPYSVSLIDSLSQQVFSVNLDSYHSDGNWQERILTPQLLAGLYTLTFTSLNSPNRTDTLIDAVAIGVVPEPGTAILILGGLGSLTFLLRRGRRAVDA